jgi:hypothetical protein
MIKPRYILIGFAAVAAVFADYSVTVSVPKTEVVEVTAIATIAVMESITVDLRGAEPTYRLRIALKDKDGAVLARKTAKLTNDQIKTMMPAIDDILLAGRGAVSANIKLILALAE